MVQRETQRAVVAAVARARRQLLRKTVREVLAGTVAQTVGTDRPSVGGHPRPPADGGNA